MMVRNFIAEFHCRLGVELCLRNDNLKSLLFTSTFLEIPISRIINLNEAFIPFVL